MSNPFSNWSQHISQSFQKSLLGRTLLHNAPEDLSSSEPWNVSPAFDSNLMPLGLSTTLLINRVKHINRAKSLVTQIKSLTMLILQLIILQATRILLKKARLHPHQIKVSKEVVIQQMTIVDCKIPPRRQPSRHSSRASRGFQSLQELTSKVDQHTEMTSESFERIKQCQTNVKISIKSIRRFQIWILVVNHSNLMKIPFVFLGLMRAIPTKFPNQNSNCFLIKLLWVQAGSTALNHDCDTASSDFFKQSKHIESYKGQKISFVKEGQLTVEHISSNLKRLEWVIEGKLGAVGLTEYSKVGDANMI